LVVRVVGATLVKRLSVHHVLLAALVTTTPTAAAFLNSILVSDALLVVLLAMESAVFRAALEHFL
jgi:hypothetical protein